MYLLNFSTEQVRAWVGVRGQVCGGVWEDWVRGLCLVDASALVCEDY